MRRKKFLVVTPVSSSWCSQRNGNLEILCILVRRAVFWVSRAGVLGV